MVVIRVPLDQYAYIETDFQGTSEEAITEYRRLVEVFKSPVEAKIGLKSIDMLRLVHKYLVTQKLELEDVESLGTLQTYSQRDIIGLLKNVMSKISREEAGTRADSKLKEINID